MDNNLILFLRPKKKKKLGNEELKNFQKWFLLSLDFQKLNQTESDCVRDVVVLKQFLCSGGKRRRKRTKLLEK